MGRVSDRPFLAPARGEHASSRRDRAQDNVIDAHEGARRLSRPTHSRTPLTTRVHNSQFTTRRLVVLHAGRSLRRRHRHRHRRWATRPSRKIDNVIDGAMNGCACLL